MYKVKTAIADTADVVGVQNRSSRREELVHLFQERNKVFLLFPGSVDIAQEKDL
jgi:hypothetical protein